MGYWDMAVIWKTLEFSWDYINYELYLDKQDDPHKRMSSYLTFTFDY